MNEVRDVRLSVFLQLIGVFFQHRSDMITIRHVTSGVYRLCPKVLWNLILTHHGSDNVLKSFIHPFHYFGLLRSISAGEVALYVIFITEGRKVMILKF